MVEIDGKKFIEIHLAKSDLVMCGGCDFYQHPEIYCEDHDEIRCGIVGDEEIVYRECK